MWKCFSAKYKNKIEAFKAEPYNVCDDHHPSSKKLLLKSGKLGLNLRISFMNENFQVNVTLRKKCS